MPQAPTTSSVDQNYFKSPTEDISAYNTRIANYNATKTPPSTTLAQDQAKTTNQGKPGYDVLGNPVVSSTPTTPPPTTPNTSAAPTLGDQTDRDALAKAQAEYQAQASQVATTIQNIQNGVTPLNSGEQAQISGIQQQYQALIDQQTHVNQSAEGLANVRGYQTGSAEYDPTFQVKTIGAIVTAGAAKIADLQTKEAAAIAQLTQSFHDNDIAAVKDAWSLYKDASTNRQNAFQKTIDDTAQAIKDAQAEKQKITDKLNTLSEDVLKNTGDGALASKVATAGSVSAAVALAGTALQSSTNPDIAQYLFYKQQAQNSGVTPQSFTQWQAAQDTKANNQAYAKAYATASGTAAGAAAGLPGTDVTPVGLGGDSRGGSILGATGLSIGGFNYLSGNTGALTRLTGPQRNAIMKEAQNFALKHGVDVSTMQAQYKAYNDVLDKNIARAAQTKIMAGEVSGTADALIAAISANSAANQKDPLASVHGNDSGMSSLRAANILDLMAGKQVNNKFAQTYSTQLQFMANDLAGYMAAARGATSPELQDQRDAAGIIANGMNAGSITAFKNAINTNEEKVAGVVNGAVDDARQSVWDLFGVGDKYIPGQNSSSDAQVQDQKQFADKVDAYVANNPDQVGAVSELYNNGFTDEQVSEYYQLQ